ncbi:ATP-binding cassette permease mdl1, partial [Coemansia sp. RSA 454]
PRVLILDEATSALDGTREARVLESLDNVAQNAEHKLTVVTIAHRASTLKQSDVIVVLGENGAVEEVGSFNELLADTSGYFYHLMAAQAAEHTH